MIISNVLTYDTFPLRRKRETFLILSFDAAFKQKVIDNNPNSLFVGFAENSIDDVKDFAVYFKFFIDILSEVDKVVIDGIRQCSIVRKLVSLYGEDRVDQIWLEVPDEIRKYRFNDRMLSKDDSTFEQANEKDQQLGLGELQTKLKKSYSIIYN